MKIGDKVIYIDPERGEFEGTIEKSVPDSEKIVIQYFDPDWEPDPEHYAHGKHTVTDRISWPNNAESLQKMVDAGKIDQDKMDTLFHPKTEYDPNKPLDEEKNWPAIIEEVERTVNPAIVKGRTCRADGVEHEDRMPKGTEARRWREVA
jgi:hypothetical protein